MNKQLKEKILESIYIPASTYRVNRQSEIIKNENHKIVLKHFKVSEQFLYAEQYEIILNQIFSSVYYKKEKEEMKSLSEILEKFIDENNYLRPIFILFKILIIMNSNQTYWKILQQIEKDLKYLECFPENYFNNDFKVLYKLVLYFSRRNNYSLKDIEVDYHYPYLTWIYQHIRGTIAYANQEYFEAIIHYKNAINYFLKDFNIKRIINCEINICAMYNRMEAYRESIQISASLVEYSLFQADNLEWKKFSIMHYLMTLYMTDSYFKILNFYKYLNAPLDVITDISAIVGVIASYQMGILEENLNPYLRESLTQRKYVGPIFDYVYHGIKLSEDTIKSFTEIYYLNRIKVKLEIL